MADIMREQMEKGDRGEAVAVAYALLSRIHFRDPFAMNDINRTRPSGRYKNSASSTDTSIGSRRQLSAAPDSARLNAQLAITMQARDGNPPSHAIRKLVELKSKDPEWLQQFGNILLQSEKFDEAMDTVRPDSLPESHAPFRSGERISWSPGRTDQASWQRAADAIAKAPDTKPDPLSPYRQNFTHIFQQIGKAFQRARPPVDPTDVWAEGTVWDENNSRNCAPLLAQTLARAGRTD